jgi:hypothetical protein
MTAERESGVEPHETSPKHANALRHGGGFALDLNQDNTSAFIG